MYSSFRQVVLDLERHRERAHIEGDLDLEHIRTLLEAVHELEHEITPDLARRAKEAIDGLYATFSDQMMDFVQKFGTIKEGRRALKGYAEKKRKSQPRQLFRNV